MHRNVAAGAMFALGALHSVLIPDTVKLDCSRSVKPPDYSMMSRREDMFCNCNNRCREAPCRLPEFMERFPARSAQPDRRDSAGPRLFVLREVHIQRKGELIIGKPGRRRRHWIGTANH